LRDERASRLELLRLSLRTTCGHLDVELATAARDARSSSKAGASRASSETPVSTTMEEPDGALADCCTVEMVEEKQCRAWAVALRGGSSLFARGERAGVTS
jgi:hypothetical protein